MLLYRATYEDQDARLRHMTFAAHDATQAAQVARDWQLTTDRLIGLALVRALQPQLELTLKGSPC
mgnify:CR=1 FL=1